MILSDLLPGYNLAKVQCVPCYRDRGNVIGMLMGGFFHQENRIIAQPKQGKPKF